jgi:hypothetical protein
VTLPSASLSLQSAIPLGLVLGFARRYCLPLHVARGVGSAALQRLDMIDHIAGAASARPACGKGTDASSPKECLAADDLLIRPCLFLGIPDALARWDEGRDWLRPVLWLPRNAVADTMVDECPASAAGTPTWVWDNAHTDATLRTIKLAMSLFILSSMPRVVHGKALQQRATIHCTHRGNGFCPKSTRSQLLRGNFPS